MVDLSKVKAETLTKLEHVFIGQIRKNLTRIIASLNAKSYYPNTNIAYSYKTNYLPLCKEVLKMVDLQRWYRVWRLI